MTGCALIDRQEHRWGLKIEGQVEEGYPRLFCGKERASDMERLHKDEDGAWLGEA